MYTLGVKYLKMIDCSVTLVWFSILKVRKNYIFLNKY